jgi:hypothetical protein
MVEPDVMMSREEIAAFLASLKKLRDGLDDFNCQLASIDGAGKRLGLLCQEISAACPPAALATAQGLTGLAQALRVFGGVTGEVLQNFLAMADVFARSARLLEIESRKGSH